MLVFFVKFRRARDGTDDVYGFVRGEEGGGDARGGGRCGDESRRLTGDSCGEHDGRCNANDEYCLNGSLGFCDYSVCLFWGLRCSLLAERRWFCIRMTLCWSPRVTELGGLRRVHAEHGVLITLLNDVGKD